VKPVEKVCLWGFYPIFDTNENRAVGRLVENGFLFRLEQYLVETCGWKNLNCCRGDDLRVFRIERSDYVYR
jgi:hypothetical protein